MKDPKERYKPTYTKKRPKIGEETEAAYRERIERHRARRGVSTVKMEEAGNWAFGRRKVISTYRPPARKPIVYRETQAGLARQLDCYVCGTVFWADAGECPTCKTEVDSYMLSYDANEYEGYSSSYNYDFDRKVSERERRDIGFTPEAQAKETQAARDWEMGYKPQTELGRSSYGWYEREWKSYESTGTWRGYDYYARPKLDYRYIEQMANAFASKYNVSVEVGQNWGIDVKKKVLTYNPLTLMEFTKAQLIATLLHEIGHLRHSTHRDNLKSKWLKKPEPVNDNVYDLTNTFEDFRIDKIMAKAYEGAEDLFSANMPIIERIAEQYKIRSLHLIANIKESVHNQVQTVIENAGGKDIDGERIQATEEQQIKAMQKVYGSKYKTLEEFKDVITKMIDDINDTPTLFDYSAAQLIEGYGEEAKGVKPAIRKILDKTNKAVRMCERAKSTQQVLEILEKKVIPHIEHLLKDALPGGGELEEMLKGVLGERAAKHIMDRMREHGLLSTKGIHEKLMGRRYNKDTRRTEEESEMMTRVESGHSDSDIAPALREGDYMTLLDSVKSAVDELVRKMKFLRSQEAAIKFVPGQRRGKLDVSRVFKIRTGNFKVFKKRMELEDSIATFSFSLVLDVSGSMSGLPQLNSTRGLVLLAEVFDALKVPFEVIMFSNTAITIKEYDQAYTRDVKEKVGRLVKAGGGGTNLYKALDSVQAPKRKEMNKQLIILSDGGVSYGEYRYEDKFREWKKKHRLNTIGVGISCGDEIVKLCLGNGVSIDDATKLPDTFATIVKKLILKR